MADDLIALDASAISATDENTAYFNSVPWCVELLKDQSFITIDTISRRGKDAIRDALFARTLATAETMPAFMTQYKLVDLSQTNPTLPPDHFQPRIQEVRCFIALANGLNGYPGIMHGGMAACIADEVTGLLGRHNYRLQVENPRPGHDLPLWATVTGDLTVKYRRPVATGQVVQVRAWYNTNKLDRNKFTTKAVIQDSSGQVLCESIVTFVAIKPGKEGLFKPDRKIKL
ncbi:hypothetical protein PV10_01434 [Exophiala mesophila]|uniref:Thioesterase domain-containing protein n=1 Tax=Exophiala mesophila TaxID=212818 RepID=A0A0D1YAQ1_EXOME|nr:uncharacterized protein PV10_01434 [Exophiala mesophila]KIV97721.1 hypothetical protein PV10_01434 [Exophiala mesophila]